MKITALVILLGIGFFAWYHYPEPAPRPEAASSPPISTPTITEPAQGPQRVAESLDRCRVFNGTRDWQDLQKIYPGMSDTELCDYVLAPDVAKLQGVNVDAEAVDSLLNRLMAENHSDDAAFAQVPDLRYYLDPQAVELMRGLSHQQLVDKINGEQSAEAAFLLAQNYLEDEQTYVTLMLVATSYSRKPGLMIDAINGCCRYSPDNLEEARAAAIKREALMMIARELGLPEAQRWPGVLAAEEISAEVLQQRADYVAELNEYSMHAYGEEWIK